MVGNTTESVDSERIRTAATVTAGSRPGISRCVCAG